MRLSHKDLARELNALERKFESHDMHIRPLFDAIRELMAPPEAKKRKIGFLVKERAARYGRGRAVVSCFRNCENVEMS
jgi:hypothetical protein